MSDPSDLERRVRELEAEVRQLRGRRPGRVRYRSAAGIGDIPLLSIALGPDPEKGERRGHARGIVAIGDTATGLVAVGGLAAGGVAIGGLSLGLASLGGRALGVFLAIGGGAAGEYACREGAAGAHVLSATRRDPEAEAYFREHGLEWLCPPLGRRPR